MRGRLGKAGFLVLPTAGVVALFALAGVSAASPTRIAADAPPGGGAPPPSVDKVQPCRGYVTGRKAIVRTYSSAGQTICGSQFGDKLTVRGGLNRVETFGGVDFVDARNGKPDDVWNGPGIDQGLFDECDLPVHELDAGKVAGKCPGVSKSNGLRSISALDYPGFLPTMDCRLDKNGRRMIDFSREPAMRAVDSTGFVDWQTVAWSALMYKWDGSSWVFQSQTAWLWDRIYDEQVKAFPGNDWRRFDTNQRWFVWFLPSQPGTYRVAIHYRWYASKGVPNYSLKVWAGRHLGDFESLPDRQACVFPGEAPPPPGQSGHYTGTNSQGTAVNFDLNGTSLTNLTFGRTTSQGACSDAGLGQFSGLFHGSLGPYSGTIAADGSFTINGPFTWTDSTSGTGLHQVEVQVTGRITGTTATGTLVWADSFTYQGVAQKCRANVTWNARK